MQFDPTPEISRRIPRDQRLETACAGALYISPDNERCSRLGRISRLDLTCSSHLSQALLLATSRPLRNGIREKERLELHR